MPRLATLSATRHELFARSVVALLLADEAQFSAAFDNLADNLTDLDLGVWSICTYWMFILHPTDHVAVQPMRVQRAAQALNYDIGYESRPTAKTYARVLSLANYVRNRLIKRGLPPKDMIDVQGFIWIGTGGYDKV